MDLSKKTGKDLDASDPQQPSTSGVRVPRPKHPKYETEMERKEAKKKANRKAAAKYRAKQKQELEEAEAQLRQLEARNRQLRRQLLAVEIEVVALRTYLLEPDN